MVEHPAALRALVEVWRCAPGWAKQKPTGITALATGGRECARVGLTLSA
jgi:hypothetical protein